MINIPTWISTVGWSPYAVINPLWAYCKENDNYPDKVILLYTGNGFIKNNYKKCKDSTVKILRSFTNNAFNPDNVIGYELKSEDFNTYAEELRKIILQEKKLEPDEIILDMTPGRKYMSALMMIYGRELNSKKVPIQVYYLHLEDDKYLNAPFQLIPAKLNNFINIFEYSSIFEDLKIESEFIQEENQFFEDIKKILAQNLWKNLEKIEEQRELLLLTSIFLGNNTRYKIMGLFKNKELDIDNSDFNNLINDFKSFNYLYSDKLFDNNSNRERVVYFLKEQGQNKLVELNKRILK